MNMNFSGTIEFYRADDSVLIVKYEGYDDPGKISGPPEDCYPPDNEMTILSITKDGKKVRVGNKEFNNIVQACWDDYIETCQTQTEAEYYAELKPAKSSKQQDDDSLPF